MTKVLNIFATIPKTIEAIGHNVFSREKLSKVFDPRFYLDNNPDVAASGIDPLVHYLRFGIDENRAPTAIFDAHFYSEVLTQKKQGLHVAAYREYLSKGLALNFAPCMILLPTFSFQMPADGLPRREFEKLVAATNAFYKLFGGQKLRMALSLFNPQLYDGNGALSASANGVTRLIHFLTRGAKSGIEPGPLFQSKVYLARLEQRGETLKAGQSPFLHFMQTGFDQRIVPNSVFDDVDYLASYPDLATYQDWLFWHFVQHGIFEGRKLDKGARVIVSIPSQSHIEGMMNHWNLFWAEQDHSFAQNDLMKSHNRHAKVLRNLVTSSIYAEITRRVTELDPAVGDILGIKALAVPPFFDTRQQVLQSIRNMAERKHYDTIICVPWLRVGGSDLVACLLAEAIKTSRPSEHLLFIRTEHSHFERPDWLPEEIEVIDASPVLKLISSQEAEDIFTTLLFGFAPARVFNVNSNLCWRVLARFGRRLQERIHLYSYLFCWDQQANGVRTGYPSIFYAPTAPYLDGILTDSRYLRDELIRIYNPPDAIKAKMFALATPLRAAPKTHETSLYCASFSNPRPLVLWAGRLDRQKRFDLVTAIAVDMPDVDFACWGEALLETPPKVNVLPANLTLKSNFKSFDELPLASADLWLFTSAWEGIPTLLIELAFRDMPIVASAVGGVPELIPPDAGYLISDIDSVQAYVTAIRQALADPEDSKARAKRLHTHAALLHTKENYVKQLGLILGHEVNHDGH